jgi:hypothetical protein
MLDKNKKVVYTKSASRMDGNHGRQRKKMKEGSEKSSLLYFLIRLF